jgi:hypothetical protein
MDHAAPALFVALEQSALGVAMRESIWLYPLANVGHILALACFAGALAIMDLRLIGAFAATSPGQLLRRARRAVIAALAAMVVTGFLLFTAEASHVVRNPVFLVKMGFIAAGVVNIVIFELFAKCAVQTLPPGIPMPPATRAAGYASLGIWLAVAACGRSIAYF